LKAGVWFRRGRLLMVSPVRGDYRRRQAEIPLIVLCRFPGPAVYAPAPVLVSGFGCARLPQAARLIYTRRITCSTNSAVGLAC
jgi:hypothetical protein